MNKLVINLILPAYSFQHPTESHGETITLGPDLIQPETPPTSDGVGSGKIFSPIMPARPFIAVASDMEAEVFRFLFNARGLRHSAHGLGFSLAPVFMGSSTTDQ